ncbi:TMV resistance protein [Salix suchowensis]|nr:TMV resistance protein [Salix suchowensis]
MNLLQAMRKQLQGELIRKGFVPEDMIKLFYVAGLYPMMGSDYTLVIYDEIILGDGEDDDNEYDRADGAESDENGMETGDKLGTQHCESTLSSPDNSAMAVVDLWLYFRSTALDAAQIYCSREQLSAAILCKCSFMDNRRHEAENIDYIVKEISVRLDRTILKSLKKLKFLYLSHSHKLIDTPNFEGFPSLEKLKLKDCISLVKVHDSIGLLSHLQFLNLQDCVGLKYLPGSICALSSLKKLNVSGCSKLEELPEQLGSLQSLALLLADETAIKSEKLSLYGCRLIFSPGKCPPTRRGLPTSLLELDLRHCNLSDDMIPSDLQASIGSLPKLNSLWLNECKSLQGIPELQSSLQLLHAKDCSSLETINLKNFWGEGSLELDGCPKLKAVEGYFNLESLRVEIVEKYLGTSDLFTEDSLPSINVHVINNLTRSATISPLQALSEKSIYSIFLPISDIPTWFSHQSEGDSVSLQVPPLDHGCKFSGFSISAVYAWENSVAFAPCYFSPIIAVTNRTKNFHWNYSPIITFFMPEVERDLTWLSCWSFENQVEGVDDHDMSWRFRDEMEEGDRLDVWIDMGFRINVKRCGIHLLYHHSDLQGSRLNDIMTISHSDRQDTIEGC